MHLVTQDATSPNPGQYMRLDSFDSFNGTLGYSFDSGRLEGATTTFGVRNMFDEEPDIADQSLGYMSEVYRPDGRYVHFTLKYKF